MLHTENKLSWSQSLLRTIMSCLFWHETGLQSIHGLGEVSVFVAF